MLNKLYSNHQPNSSANELFTMYFSTSDESILFVFITYKNGNITFLKLHKEQSKKISDELIFVEKVKEFPTMVTVN